MSAATAWVNETVPANNNQGLKLEWSAEGTAADAMANGNGVGLGSGKTG
jgi:hypothetical protein